jgi:hypothetical protein
MSMQATGSIFQSLNISQTWKCYHLLKVTGKMSHTIPFSIMTVFRVVPDFIFLMVYTVELSSCSII